MLRPDVAKIIASTSHTPDEKAIMILLYLEYNCSMSLHGNGWLEDDEIAEEAFTDDSKNLTKTMQSIVS